MRYLALDFETSGTSQERHAPVTLGLALMDGLEVLDSREWIFAPPRHWKDKEKITREYDLIALSISGVTWTRILKEGLPHSQVMSQVRSWAIANGSRELAVVAFNAPFDFGFWSTTLMLGGDWHPDVRGKWVPLASPLLGPWQCALMLAREQLRLPGDYKLDDVAAHFGLSRSTDKHGALEDAILAGQVFAHLSGVAKEPVSA